MFFQRTLITLFLTFVSIFSTQVFSSSLNGYELLQYNYQSCKGVDEEIVYIEVNQNLYPNTNAFTLIEGSADIRDPAIEKLCISHSRKKIYMLFSAWENGICGAISWMNGAIRDQYSDCNSNFYRIDGTESLGTNLIGCLILACLPALGGLHDIEFKSNHFYEAVKHLDLTNYRSFDDLFKRIDKDIEKLVIEFSKLIGKSYNYYSYDLDNFERDARSFNYDVGKVRTLLNDIRRLSNRFSKSFKKYEKRFEEIKTSYDDLEEKSNALDAKKIRFVEYHKTGKADADERIRKERAERQRLAKEEKDRKEKKIKRDNLVIASKKILFNLGYEIDSIDTSFNLKAKTALVAFQKDYKLEPIINEPSEALLVELQRAFRNSPNPIDLSNYELIGSGSGFLVDNEGHVVTNVHVVDECSLVTVGKRIPANLEKADRTNDVAILKINNVENISPLSIAKKDIELGEEVFVAGFPINMLIENLNFTSGSISSEVGFGQNINQFQFTAPIQPGNSGGPIFNSYGGVVGIAIATASTKEFEELVGSNIQNINFGIKASTFKSLLDQTDVTFKEGNANWFSSQKNVASTAKTGTVLIQCWKD